MAPNKGKTPFLDDSYIFLTSVVVNEAILSLYNILSLVFTMHELQVCVMACYYSQYFLCLLICLSIDSHRDINFSNTFGQAVPCYVSHAMQQTLTNMFLHSVQKLW